jgi:GAF domain-containing protein
MVGLEQLCLIFGRPPGWSAMIPLYFEDLADLGPDLVLLAVRRCRQRLKFFPRPAEIIEQVADELASELARQAEETNRAIREQLMLPTPTRHPPTAEQIAAVRATVAQTTQAIAERQQTFVDEHDLEERRPRPLSEIAQRPRIPMPGECPDLDAEAAD